MGWPLMNELERHFINQYQGGFPVVESPYSTVAANLGTDETTLISTIQGLLDKGILSRFGPLYDASSIGGGLTLAAMSVPEDEFDCVVDLINQLPEVAHNYRREHTLNMWFVIATETPDLLQKAIAKIERLTDLPVYNFPKIQTFYLGLWLGLDKAGRVTTGSIEQPSHQTRMTIDNLDRDIIHATQSGLALHTAPYNEIAKQCGCDMHTVMSRMQWMLKCGVIRRIGAVPNHYRLGLRSNGMSVWDVADDRLDALGKQVGKLDFVSHCYERPRHLPQWPYNLYAMVHGTNQDEVNRKVSRIAELLGNDCQQHNVLLSSKILKKSGLRLVA
jgi:DNA-binding Lrp family transcriptional regulator